MKLSRAYLGSLLVLFVACGDAAPPLDGGGPPPGSGVVDAGAGGDPLDAGGDLPDAGGDAPDAGDDAPDAGDAGDDIDAGDELDAGDDAGDDAGLDAGAPAPVNVIDNWGFETWPGAIPEKWLGSTSNLPADNVEKVTAGAFEGVNAARLINASTSHKRFSTQAKSMAAGRYSCTFQARGTGEVRNAFYHGDYSSYSGYATVDTMAWTKLSYSFNLASDVFDTFELIFSVRNTSGDHLLIDDVRCTRAAEPCDEVMCDGWERCVNATATCTPLAGRCNDDAGCSEWQTCDATHTCVLAADRCARHADCAGAPGTPVCDAATHRCVPGDPCAGVVCAHLATACNPTTGACELPAGGCFTTYDCQGALPACDAATRRCVAADHPANIIRNGSFESWSTRPIPYQGDHLVPDHWYGVDNGLTDPGSEIKASRLARYTAAAHGGATALQFVVPIQVAERFSLEKFDVPTGNYSCSYRVRGHGTLRHRSYSSAGWSPQTDFLAVDSDDWQPVFFRFTGNVRDWRLFFYASRSHADRDHLQVDDVVCTKD